MDQLPANFQLTSESYVFPASFTQRRLWFIDQLNPGDPVYNMPAAYRLQGALDRAALERSLERIVERHETLRTTFDYRDDQVVQIVHQFEGFHLPVFDFEHLPAGQRFDAALARIITDCRRAFDLASDPLIRLVLYRLAADDHILVKTTHHTVSDGWSMQILRREISEFYRADVSGQEPNLPELEIQYGDYSAWQQEWMQGAVLERQLAYWHQQLKNAPPTLELPYDHPRPAVLTSNGARLIYYIPDEVFQALKQVARQAKATDFMACMAALQLLLHQYSGQEDICVGIPIANRQNVQAENLIGFFANTLVIRSDLSANPTFLELLQQVRDTALEAFSYQDVPFEKLVEETQVERSLARSPIFQVMFAYQNTPPGELELPGLEVMRLETDIRVAQFDLSVIIAEEKQGTRLTLSYNTDLFEAATIERLAGHFLQLLQVIVADPTRPVQHYCLLSLAERQQILVDWNATGRPYPQAACIPELFAQQVARTPHHPAVYYEGQQLTFQELDEHANQLANYLQSLGVGPETIVPFYLERSLNLIVALVAILKAGGAYLPLDPEYPPERLKYILQDVGQSEYLLPVVLSEAALCDNLPTGLDARSPQVVCLDRDQERIRQQAATAPVVALRPDNLAYVIYTSGSTGLPKGSLIEHAAVLNLWAEHERLAYAGVQDPAPLRLTLNFPIQFDGSVNQWIMLLSGHTLYILPPEIRLDPEALVAYVRQHRIQVFDVITSMLKMVLEQGLLDESYWVPAVVMTGGEALDQEIWDQFARSERARCYNLYGPTECTVVAAQCSIHHFPQHPSIGRPVQNSQLYVLNPGLEPVPVGVAGELYIGGVPVGRGYLNRPELNAERFIPDPFSPQPGARLYRSGDRARYFANGYLEFLGRMDGQVKIRGFRVELGEIEAQLLAHPAVQAAVVLLREDTPGDQRLAAYLVAREAVSPQALRARLQGQLPGYMLPATFTFLDRLPLTSNGKVDRRRLPVPEPPLETGGVDRSAGRDSLEASLVRIWEEVLKVRPIGIHDDFFELGGHSLLAVQLFSQIEKALGKKLPLATLFQSSTIADQAQLLRQGGWDAYFSPLVVVQPNGSKPPLFCMAALGGNVLTYRDLSIHLGEQQPVYALQSRGLDGIDDPLHQVEAIASDFIAAMRSVQPNGPYFLCGSSFGGIVAYEIGRQLEAIGQPVGLVALFDTFGPGHPQRIKNISQLRRWYYRIADRLDLHITNLVENDWPGRWEYLGVKGYRLWRRYRNRFVRALREAREGTDELPEAILAIQNSNLAAHQKYIAGAYGGRVDLFRASRQSRGIITNATMGWETVVRGELNTFEVRGHHGALVYEPQVRNLAPVFQRSLEQTQENVAQTSA
ncbi:MAG: amino acid adenylation domain-containing protein [Anaerolineales bacterium]|nr:amino acid adenylation domain-containing protein [Anaerolineales bacterium]